jgi:Mn-dependent DtxR family transcriptional regulator
MKTNVEVLRAILRCSRHRRAANRAALRLRVECSENELGEALAMLQKDGLVALEGDHARLTMAGLAVAVASLPKARKQVATKKARSAA